MDNFNVICKKIDFDERKNELNTASDKARAELHAATTKYGNAMQKLIKDAYVLGYYDGLNDKQGIGDNKE